VPERPFADIRKATAEGTFAFIAAVSTPSDVRLSAEAFD
jgi:hypothetical protein